MCLNSLPPSLLNFLNLAMQHQVSEDTLRLVEKCRMEVMFKEEPAPKKAAPPLPVYPPEKQAALDDAFAARGRSRRMIQELREHRCVARPNCGHGRIKHLRRNRPGEVTDALLRPKCGRHDCQVCWRIRLIKTIRRGVKALLYHRDGDVRMEKVHVKEIAWAEWPSLNLALRRKYTKDCGRLHLRIAGDRCLVFCAEPFQGSTAMSGPQAMDCYLSKVQSLSVERHSFRLLGCWADKQESEWEQLGEYANSDLEPIKQAIEKLGKHASWGFERHPEIHQGMLWNCSSEDEAEALFAKVKAACPSLDIEDSSSSRTKSDSAPDENPFCGSAARTAEPFDPLDTQQWEESQWS
jgi:hypothetical protein